MRGKPHFNTFDLLVEAVENPTGSVISAGARALIGRGKDSVGWVRKTASALSKTTGAAVGLVGSALSGNMGDQARNIQRQGIGGLVTRATASVGAAGSKYIDQVRKNYSDNRSRQLLDYYNKLNLPKGWPKKGSVFVFGEKGNTPSGTKWVGPVVYATKTGEKLILTIDASPEKDTGRVRRRTYVLELSTSSSFPVSMTGIVVSDYDDRRGKYIKNEEESEYTRKLTYVPTDDVFVADLAAVYRTGILVSPQNDKLRVGSTISGADVMGNYVTGTIERRTTQASGTGTADIWIVLTGQP